jgi:hypothetical protein
VSAALDLRIRKRIAGTCGYSGCTVPAADGADYCAPHDAHERGRDAAKKRRRRQRLADGGLCAAGCGKKVGKQKRADGSAFHRECRACAKAKAARRRAVPGDSQAVPGDGADPASERWRVDPGTTWNRYRGKGRRGRLTREEQIDERIRDVRIARDELVKLERALERLKAPEVIALPPIQRAAAHRQIGLFIGLPSRILEDMADWCR